MDARSWRRPSPAMIVAAVALVLALGGSAAALPPDSNSAGAGGWKAFTVVGGPGAPTFGDGGQGDCLWGPAAESIGVVGGNPPAFYRDPWDVVHLVGLAAHVNGPGGDGRCGGDGLEDSVVFRLPPGYRPENMEILGSGGTAALVVPDEGAALEEGQLPPGAVVPLSTFGVVVLDGATFRAAGPGTKPLEADAARAKGSSLGELRRLGH